MVETVRRRVRDTVHPIHDIQQPDDALASRMGYVDAPTRRDVIDRDAVSINHFPVTANTFSLISTPSRNRGRNG